MVGTGWVGRGGGTGRGIVLRGGDYSVNLLQSVATFAREQLNPMTLIKRRPRQLDLCGRTSSPGAEDPKPGIARGMNGFCCRTGKGDTVL